MTDTNKLKELAKRATPGPWSAVWEEGDDTAWPNLFPVIQAESGENVVGNEGFYSDLEQDKANAKFCAAANPAVVLELIAEVERMRIRLEISDKHPYDGIDTRNATIEGLERLIQGRWREEVERLKAKNEALQAALLKAVEVVAKFDPEGAQQWLAALEGGADDRP